MSKPLRDRTTAAIRRKVRYLGRCPARQRIIRELDALRAELKRREDER